MTMRENLLVAAMMLTGCGGAATEADFSSALPTQEMVKIQEPKKNGQALVAGAGVDALERDKTSELYQLTRQTTVFVNGTTVGVLGLLERITDHPPTTLSGDTAVWGPFTEALARNAWRLTVKKTGETTYSYALAGKNKQADDSAFQDVLTGTNTASLDAAGEVRRGFGSGQMTVDTDRLRALQETDSGEGALHMQYARPDIQQPVTVDAQFTLDHGDKSREATYHYSAVNGQGGEFDFKVFQDMYKPSGGTNLLETLTIKSRWKESGAGRSDVKLTGGDLKGEATVNECWDAGFLSVYLKGVSESDPHYGNEQTDCAFTSAVYSSL